LYAEICWNESLVEAPNFEENTETRKHVSQSDVRYEIKSKNQKTPLSRALGNSIELDLVTSSGESRLLDSLAEEVQVGEQLASLLVGGAP
jgi:hypothetical protein